MNLSILEVRKILASQEKYLERTGAHSTQLLMAEDLLNLHEQVGTPEICDYCSKPYNDFCHSCFVEKPEITGSLSYEEFREQKIKEEGNEYFKG